MQPRQRLGDILIEHGRLSDADLADVLELQRRTKERLGKILMDKGLIQPVDLLRALAQQFGVRFVDLTDTAIDWQVAKTVPDALARRHQALVIGAEDGRLVVAMANPSDVFALDDIRTVTGRDVIPVLAEPTQLANAIEKVAKGEHEVAAAIQQAVDSTMRDDPGYDLQSLEVVEDAPIIRFVDLMISRAVAERASDIHVEPADDGLRIRFRIDGVLHDVMKSPRSIQAGVVSRLKVMADINIAERRIPQDGRASAKVGARTIDLRIATVPTMHGEAAVMRILDKNTGGLRIQEAGFLPETFERYKAAYSRPWGAILVTGPTGSGKTTTLYSTLRELNHPSRNLMTIEDPVEYRLEGIKQVQVNPKAGLTFANALRSFLRADPDVMLVGEIRDRETAIIAAEASLTGHLVLSSLHTNDAASTPLRLLEIGVEPFLVTSSIQCVLGQRLARRLCDRCKVGYEPTEVQLHEARWPDTIERPTQFFHAVGCSSCGNTGYAGRFAIHEVMLMSEDISRLVIARAHAEEVQKQAEVEGMLTLRQDGLRKVGMGQTTLEELARVVI